MTEQDIIDFIGEEVKDCEWCKDMTFDDHDPVLEVEDDEGNKFEITVKRMKK